MLFLSDHWWHYHEWAEWYEDVVYLSWACTFFLESTDDSCVLYTQLERSCCDVMLHCKALQLSELQICHWFWLAFKMSWFSWDLTSLTSNSLIFRFIRTRICKNAEINENKCNWIESRMMIYDWSFMTLMSKTSRMRFLIILKFKTWVFRIIWYWYWCQESNVSFSLKKSFEWHVKAFNLSSILSR